MSSFIINYLVLGYNFLQLNTCPYLFSSAAVILPKISSNSLVNKKAHSNQYNILMEKFIGFVDGDGYIEIGPQKQYNKNGTARSTIRLRLTIRLHENDRELLELFNSVLNMGKTDYLKKEKQYRLNIYKADIYNTLYPYLIDNNLEFLIYNRRKQFFLLRYIFENNIKH